MLPLLFHKMWNIFKIAGFENKDNLSIFFATNADFLHMNMSKHITLQLFHKSLVQ